MFDKRMFIERRPETGDNAVRTPDSERASAVLPTQGKGDRLGKGAGRRRFVERVRNMDRGHPDKWRRP